jgi:hypothetical protein
MLKAFAVVIWIAAGFAAASAQEMQPVDVELVLLADSSGSIDDSEIRFQRQGYASAITGEEVLGAIASGLHGRIALTYVEWGDLNSQDVVVPWTVISDEASAKAFADQLLAAPRKARGRNAIGSALAVAQELITKNAYEGQRKVIDLSADSANSWNGIPLQMARESVLAQGMTINGLAILCRQCSGRPVSYDLEQAFEQRIIGGPEHFVITVDGPQRFATAVRTKMVREIAGVRPTSRPLPVQQASSAP